MIHLNSAGLQYSKPGIRDRFRLLKRVILWFFRPGMYHGIHQEIDEFGRIVVSGWIKTPRDTEYKYHYVTYDGKTIPVAYVEGILLDQLQKEIPLKIGKVIESVAIKNTSDNK